MEENTELLERCLNSPSSELKPLFDEAYALSRTCFSNVICFSMPGMVHFDTSFYKATNSLRFPAISITGNRCQLKCEHCNGKLLDNMLPATTPEHLFDLCAKIEAAGGKGCLISGGSSKDGNVPLMKFVPSIKRIKQELNLDVVVHTGIVYPKLAAALAEAEIDAAMIDILGSNKTIHDIYHLNCTVDIFDNSLYLLTKNNIPIVPHIVAGIHYGKLKGEEYALRMISKYQPAAVIFVVLTPLANTRLENFPAPSPLDIARLLLASRLMLVNTPILLGCARPGGVYKSKLDILAIEAGVNGIAYPSEEGFCHAKKKGLKIKFSEECCSLFYKDLAIQSESSNLMKDAP